MDAKSVANPTPQTNRLRVLAMISSMRGGGSEQQTLLLLRHLDRDRFDPHLYLTDPTGDLLKEIPGDVTIHAFEEQKTPSRFHLPGAILRQQIRHLKTLLINEQIDVIYDRTFHMSMIAGPAGKQASVPRISTIVSPPNHALPLLEQRYRWLKRHQLRRAYRQSKKVIAVSQQAARSAEKYYRLPPNRVITIANPVDRHRIQQLAQLDKPERDDRWTFACVARMTEEKGHSDLIRAIQSLEETWPEELQPIHLWLIGDGPLRQALEEQASNLQLHQVSFLGTQSNPWKFINSADAVILPSHFEGMPNVALEAMSLRTAVIATRIGGTNELEKEKPTLWWVNPHSPESIANAMTELATRPSEVMQRLDAAEKLLVKNHDTQIQIKKIEDLLIEAV